MSLFTTFLKRFLIPSGIYLLLILPQVESAIAEPFTRKPWTVSRVKGSPDPPRPYVSEGVFAQLEINQGLEIVPLDGRLFVVERGGKIWSFVENGGAKAEAALFIDLKTLHSDLSTAYGIAFHPKWKENSEVYLTYTIGKGLGDGSRLSRFRFSLSDSGVPTILADSEENLLTWRSGGHNGANIKFGPDGMLYLSTGDANVPNPPDLFKTGQDNSDLLSCVLRIDVDNVDQGKKYSIPSDNPFVGRQNVRPEIWAFGFRNPWKMSFDSRGRLWVGDVGWELWEMIFLVEKGGNYGWSAMEASNPVLPATATDLAPITAPVVAHPHTEAASITGGFEYRGSRLPELQGAYVYGDYETGLIWALRHDGEKVVEHKIIADTPHKIATFGLGNDGELYYTHYTSPTTFHRLVPNPQVNQTTEFPRKLSETGVFADVATQKPSPGVYQFSIHEPMWQDGAKSTRYVALPDRSGIDTNIVYHENGSRRITTTWPENTVLAKTIQLAEMPVETQLLHFDGNSWNGYSYRWNKAATDAELVNASGVEFEVSDKRWKGGPRYRIPSRAECMRCHNMWNKFTPAFDAMQLAKFPEYPHQSPQEVATALGLANSNFFYKNESGQLANSRGRGSVEKRARSWLHANCAHCHRRHGGGSAPLEVNFERSLSESVTLWQTPTRGDFGMSDARTIVPGQPWRSVINYRISSVGNGHMPPLGPHEVDDHGAALLWKWVAGLPSETTPKLPIPGVSDTSAAMFLANSIAAGELTGKERNDATQEGLATQNQNISALFERFRPPGERPAPRALDANHILKLSGNASNGAKLLSTTGKLASCFACHKIGGQGGVLGPDLSASGSRLTRQQLLESLTQPSKTIAPEYRLWVVGTENGDTWSGYQIEQTETSLSLKLATGQTQVITLDRIKSKEAQTTSLMPEGLLNLITAQEAADLLAHLETFIN